MEKNTVLLSVEDYNELRDFQKKTSEGYIEVYGNCGLRTYYTTKDEAFKEITAHNKELQDKIYELNDEIAGKPKGKTLKDVKGMSIWQFIKWRKNGKV